MRSVLKTDFLWLFLGGFALGALAMVTLNPAAATPADYAAPTVQTAP